jgi:hypothetical protein
MNRRFLWPALLAVWVAPAWAAGFGPACAAKQASIEAQIAAAQARGNRQELAGLNRALKATKAHCTDVDLERARDSRIRKAQRELAEREADLAEARGSGDQDKIAKRSAKVDDARRKLAEAEKPLAR